MAKTKEITLMCESTQSYSTYENKIKVVIDVTNEDLSNLINSIPKEEYFKWLDDSVFEEWAEQNGYQKEVSVK
jgi:hypothetical protein